MGRDMLGKGSLVFALLIACAFLNAAWVPFSEGQAQRKTEIKVISADETSVSLDIDIFGAELMEYNAASLTYTGKELFSYLKIDEYAFTGEIGKPKMPMVTAVLDVPHRADIDFEIISADYEEIDLSALGINNRIAPALASVPKLENSRADFVIDEELYNANSFYPDRIGDIEESGGLARGHRLATLRLYPVQYNPVSKKVRCYTELQVRVNFPGGDIFETQRVIGQDYSTVWEEFIRSIVINYPEYLRGVAPLPIYYDIFYNGEAAGFVNKLATWKKRQGYDVRKWNAAGWSAAAIEDSIEAQNPKATYLVIVGDPNSSTIALPPAQTGGESNDQTDLYYAETNGSGYLPDMFNGRICVLDTLGGHTVVDKAIRFAHANFGSAGYAWLKKACLIAGYDASYQPVGIATNAYCRSLMLPYGYQVDTLVIASSEQEARIVSQINAGRAWVVYTAHGSQTYWAISSSGDFTIPELSGTTNLDMYCTVAGHCCLAGDYQYSSNCFAETWDRLSNKGGITYYGSVPSTYWDEDDWLQRRYFDAIYTDSITGRLYERGRNTQWGLYWINDHTSSSLKQYYFEAYHIFNDPSLDLWTDTPHNFTVTHDPTVPPVSGTFAVNVKEASTPVQDALVCCWVRPQVPDMHVSGYTDASGNVTLSVSPSTAGDTMYVTVTKHNFIPYEGYAIVLDAGMPALPTIISPLDFARLPVLNPTLRFTSTDPQGQNIRYRVFWDTDPAFASPDSSTTADQASGAVVSFNFPSNLTNGQTYWWKVKCTDVGGSGYWTACTVPRSFTIYSGIPANTCSWFQTTNAQFNFNTFGSTVVQGDSIVLGMGTLDTLLSEGFESTTFPPTDWVKFAGSGNGSTNDWARQTDQYHSGSASAGIKYDGSNQLDRFLVAKRLSLKDVADAQLVFWSRDNWASYYEYHGIWVSTTSQASQSAFAEVAVIAATAEDTWEQRTVDLSAYDGRDTVFVAFRYNEYNGADWWIDDVMITGDVSSDYGTMTGVGVVYHDLSLTYPRLRWGDVVWRKASAGDSIGVQVEYYNGATWQLVPNGVIPGNSTGHFSNMLVDTLKMTNVDTVTYNNLRVKALFYRAAKSPDNPALLDWEVGNLSGYIGIDEVQAGAGVSFGLNVYPSVAMRKMRIAYGVGSNARDAALRIYDASGRIVKSFSNLALDALRPTQIIWDGTDDAHRNVPAGVYFVKLEADGKQAVQKAVLLK